MLSDSCRGKNTRHFLTGLLRQSVFGRLAGYEEVNEADRLALDPAIRWIFGGHAVAKQAASASQIGRFETEWLAGDENFAVLSDLCGRWIDRVHGRCPPKAIVLDMDSSFSPTYGEQEGTAYNGHFGCTCYHPLFVFNQFGDLEHCALRPGNVHSADGWRSVLEPVVARYRNRKICRYFRADAAFANPEGYEFLEAEDFKYAIRLPANRVLQDRIAYLLKRPIGRPPHQVRLQLHALAYNLANFMRTLALPQTIAQWSLTSLREKLVKIGARIVTHARYVMFQMAEVAVPRELFGEILRLIAQLRAPPTPA